MGGEQSTLAQATAPASAPASAPLNLTLSEFFGSAANAEGYMAARAAINTHGKNTTIKVEKIQQYLCEYAMEIIKIVPFYKMRGSDLIQSSANGSPSRYLNKCFVKWSSTLKYVGILQHSGIFINEYTNVEESFEPDTFYIFVPCKQMLLSNAYSDGIRNKTEIDMIFIVVRGFLDKLLDNARQRAAAAGEDPTPHRGGRRKKSSKRRLMRRKSVRKLKKD